MLQQGLLSPLTDPDLRDRHLKFVLQLLLNPLGDMEERHLPLAELRAHLQLQLGRDSEAVPVRGKEKGRKHRVPKPQSWLLG